MSEHDEIDALARVAVEYGFRLHRDLGPGLLESAYENARLEIAGVLIPFDAETALAAYEKIYSRALTG